VALITAYGHDSAVYTLSFLTLAFLSFSEIGGPGPYHGGNGGIYNGVDKNWTRDHSEGSTTVTVPGHPDGNTWHSDSPWMTGICQIPIDKWTVRNRKRVLPTINASRYNEY
jgi:hypothetical protein